MTYEKKYKESLALMVDCIPDEDGYVHVRPQDIFPELKQSGDEKTRKRIIALVNAHGQGIEEKRKTKHWFKSLKQRIGG